MKLILICFIPAPYGRPYLHSLYRVILKFGARTSGVALALRAWVFGLGWSRRDLAQCTGARRVFVRQVARSATKLVGGPEGTTLHLRLHSARAGRLPTRARCE